MTDKVLATWNLSSRIWWSGLFALYRTGGSPRAEDPSITRPREDSPGGSSGGPLTLSLSFLYSKGWRHSSLLCLSVHCCHQHLHKLYWRNQADGAKMSLSQTPTSGERSPWFTWGGSCHYWVFTMCQALSRCQGYSIRQNRQNPAVLELTFYDTALTICLWLSTSQQPGPNLVPRIQQWVKHTST